MQESAAVSRVAVVGLGGMGARMAARLIDAGHRVIVWNRTPQRAAPLLERGAEAATSPADAASRAEILITMVADPAALSAVTEGDQGVAAGAGTGLVVVEMSTVGQPAIRRLASLLPDTVALVDAPVLGSLGEAEEGALAIFVGGPQALVDRITPLLSVLGTPIPVGPLGSGAAAKLVANATLVGAMGTLGEALALADGLGLTRDAAFRVLAATPLGTQSERRRPAIESGDYPRRFRLSLAAKDAALIAQAAAGAGTELRVLRAAQSWFTDAEAAGAGDRDYASVLETITARPRHPVSGTDASTAPQTTTPAPDGAAEPARSPEQLAELFLQRANAADVDAVVALYEPDAVLVAAGGALLRGHAALRGFYARLLADRPAFTGEPQAPIRCGDLALTSTRFVRTGPGPDGTPVDVATATTEIARRQRDGTWLWAVDQPDILA